MLKIVAPCKRLVGAEKAHPWQREIHAYFTATHVMCDSTASYSSSSRKSSSSLHNYYIRKRRKWPLRPFYTQWAETFAGGLAKRSFKESTKKSRNHLLHDLMKSCAAYEIELTPQAYRFLFKNLIFKPPPNWADQVSEILDRIENVESFETPECLFTDLIKFFGDNGCSTVNEAVELFYRMPKLRCVPSVEMLNSLLSVLSKDEEGLKIVPQVLLKSQEMGIRFDDSCYSVLIRRLCGLGKVKVAFELLNHMVEEGFELDQKVCSLMLATMCRHKDVDGVEILRFLENLKGLGFVPAKVDFSNLMKFLVKRGKGSDTLKVLKQMKLQGIEWDIVCFNMVLDDLIFNNDFLGADKVFDEIIISGLIPDINTYNVYIKGLCMQKKVEDGIFILESMEDMGCSPDSHTYSIILRALCESGDLEKVIAVVNGMKQKGKGLNAQICESMIDGLVCNSDTDKACSFIKEMLSDKYFPHSTVLDKIKRLLCENGLCSKSTEMLEQILIKGVVTSELSLCNGKII